MCMVLQRFAVALGAETSLFSFSILMLLNGLGAIADVEMIFVDDVVVRDLVVGGLAVEVVFRPVDVDNFVV